MIRRAAVSLALLAALATPTASAGTASAGLYGSVTRGPTKPVCSVGSSCTAPAANVSIAFTRRGETVHARTDSRGHYRLALRPGIYTVSIGTRVGRVSPVEVTVASVFRHVDLTIDTGIR